MDNIIVRVKEENDESDTEEDYICSMSENGIENGIENGMESDLKEVQEAYDIPEEIITGSDIIVTDMGHMKLSSMIACGN
jgi:hypothetical protein